jgi:hypothetical protein
MIFAPVILCPFDTLISNFVISKVGHSVFRMGFLDQVPEVIVFESPKLYALADGLMQVLRVVDLAA